MNFSNWPPSPTPPPRFSSTDLDLRKKSPQIHDSLKFNHHQHTQPDCIMAPQSDIPVVRAPSVHRRRAWRVNVLLPGLFSFPVRVSLC